MDHNTCQTTTASLNSSAPTLRSTATVFCSRLWSAKSCVLVCSVEAMALPDAAAASPCAKRRRVLGASSESKIDCLSATIAKEQHRQGLAKAISHLEKDPQLTNYIVYLLDSGKLKDPQLQNRSLLPPSTNKFALVKMEIKDDILVALWPSVLTSLDKLKDFKKSDKMLTPKCLTYALRMDQSCAVFCKSIGALTEKCVERHEQLGNPLKDLIIGDRGEILWSARGAFFFAPVGDGPYNEIRSYTGHCIKLDSFGHVVDKTWAFDKNHDLEKATLSKGLINQKVLSLFPKALQDQMKLLKLDRVPSSCLSAASGSRESLAEGGDPNSASEATEVSSAAAHSPKPLVGTGGALTT